MIGGPIASGSGDDLGRRTAINRANGVNTSVGYDTLSRLTQLAHALPGGAYNQTITFSRNTAGQITGRTASNNVYDWAGGVTVTVHAIEAHGLIPRLVMAELGRIVFLTYCTLSWARS